jgi:hypothetical protein
MPNDELVMMVPADVQNMQRRANASKLSIVANAGCSTIPGLMSFAQFARILIDFVLVARTNFDEKKDSVTIHDSCFISLSDSHNLINDVFIGVLWRFRVTISWGKAFG